MTIGVTVDIAATAFPLVLTIGQDGVGGLSGLSPTVALRDAATLDSYLDWNDNTFKTSGWTTKLATLSDVGGGQYQRSLSLVAIGATSGKFYSAEYAVDDGGSIKGVAQDLLIAQALSADRTKLTELYKLSFNRMVLTPGSPGVIQVFDDDDTTVIKTITTTDSSGGPILAVVGAAFRRNRAT